MGGVTARQAAWISLEWAQEPVFTISRNVFAAYLVLIVGSATAAQTINGYASAFSVLLVAIAAPIVGAISDATGRRRPFLLTFGGLCAAACAGLWFASPEAPVWTAFALVMLATFAVEMLVVFVNAVLPTVAQGARLGVLSAVGFAASQLAGLIALAVVIFGFAAPPVKEALDAARGEPERLAMALAGLWLAVFLLPAAVLLREPAGRPVRWTAAARAGVGRIVATVKKARAYRNMAVFLVGRMIGTDGSTLIFAFGTFLAVGLFGWTAGALATFGAVVTVCACLGGLLGGWTDARFGSKPTVIGALLITALALVGICTTTPTMIAGLIPADGATGSPLGGASELAFSGFACVVALMAGPTIASCRTWMAKITPADARGEFFGLYALSGRATNFLGPLMVAAVTGATGSQALGLSVALVFLIGGAAILALATETPADPVAAS